MLAALLAALLTPAAVPAQTPQTRDVLVVGNNWDGTAHIVDPHTFERLARLNIVPDLDERMAEIRSDPVRLGFFLGIRRLVGEGHDQFVDDAFTSADGTMLYVSRPSLADVVAIDLRTRAIAWRVKVDGHRADHMAISPDGRRLLVSASTAGVVDVIDTRAGRIIARFDSGDQPHENNYSRDGSRIFHASIGTVFTPTDDPALDATKGERVFQIVAASDYRILRRIDMGRKLDEFGRPEMSGAVRPMALSPDERFVYFQVSFHHGFVEYDLEADRVTRVAELPLSREAANTPREGYLLDSAHHGLAMNPEGTKLCAAGTMSDYAAVVDRETFAATVIPVGPKPYWSTNSEDGRYCFVSVSGDDAVSVISYEREREIARIPVGDHPQRMRTGRIRVGLLGIGPRREGGRRTAARGGARRARPRLRVRVAPRRVRARRPATIRVRVTTRRDGRLVPVRGARVHVAGVTARTDRRGRARLHKRYGFERVRTYRVRASRPGHRPARARIRSLRPRR